MWVRWGNWGWTSYEIGALREAVAELGGEEVELGLDQC